MGQRMPNAQRQKAPNYLLSNDAIDQLNQDFLLAQADSMQAPQASPIPMPSPSPMPEEQPLPEAAQAPMPEPEIVPQAAPMSAQTPVSAEPEMPSLPSSAPQEMPKETERERLNREIGELITQSDGGVTDALKAERENIENLVKQRELFGAQDVPWDLTGLMALVDVWTGSNFAASYRPPETRKDRQQLMVQLQDQINAAKRGLSKNQMDYLGTKLKARLEERAELDKKEMSRLESIAKGEAKKEKALDQKEKILTRAVEKYNSDPELKELNKRKTSALAAKQLLSLDNPIAGEAAKTAIARLSGEVGNLSDTDRASFGGSKAWNSRVEQLEEQAFSGELTPENKQFLQQVVAAFETSINSSIGSRSKALARQFSKINNVNERDVYGTFRPGEPWPEDEKTSQDLKTVNAERMRKFEEAQKRKKK